MSERPTLTIAVECPTCGGTRVQNDKPERGSVSKIGIAWVKPPCPDCTDGTIRQAVSCGNCKHADTTHPWSPEKRIWCFEHDREFPAGFGCTAWATREGA